MTTENKQSTEEVQEPETLELKELTIFEQCTLGSVDDMKRRLKEAPSDFDINALDEDGYSLLMIAAKLKHSAISALLIESGADVNVKGTRDVTALMVACQSADIETAQMLLEEERHVDLEATDSSGNTVLMYAAKSGSFQIAEMLTKAGSKLDTSNQNKGTALSLGVLYGKENVVGYLLKNGADANAVDVHGNSSLHYAATLGYTAIIKLLLKGNAKSDLQNEQNKTPAQLAHQPNIVELLTEQ